MELLIRSLDYWTYTFLGGLLYASVFEWTFHRFVMHKPVPGFNYPFKTHAQTHHRIYKGGPSYHSQRQSDLSTIPMAWWNGPALVFLTSLLPLLVSILSGCWSIVIIFTSVCAIYFIVYERIHWCMHRPMIERRLIERSWIFYRLNGHHLLHHRYMNRNFNVVLPIADLLMGTFLLRSKIAFNQARGPSVPDVQPKVRRENRQEQRRELVESK